MALLERLRFLLRITRSYGIMRRYFVVNGFDGALTMLGMLLGFQMSGPVDLSVVLGACLGAAVALGVSGVSSAYISETAERNRALAELEAAMVKDLRQSAHAVAARWVPVLVAAVNGAAPLLIALAILLPVYLSQTGITLPLAPLWSAMTVALVLIFLLGVFLGRIAGRSWLRSGLQTLLVALLTMALIMMIGAG